MCIRDRNNALQLQTGESGALANEFRPNPIASPWAAKPVEVPAPTVLGEGFRPDYEKDHLDYTREIPEHFSEGSDDQLMNNMLNNYAIEGRGADGEKTGKYYMDRSSTSQVAREVVSTHMGYKGEKLDNYVSSKMGEIWPLYDDQNKGYIEADRAPVVLRRVVGDVEIANGLQ